MRAQGFSGSETTVRTYLTSLRDETEPRRGPRRHFPRISQEKRSQQRLAISSRRTTWLVLRREEDLSQEDQRNLALVLQAHPQVTSACLLAQAFAQMIRIKNAPALEAWLESATRSGIRELRSFVAGSGASTRRFWPLLPIHGVKSKVRSTDSSCSNGNPMDVLDLTCHDPGCLLEVLELSTEDDGDPKIGFASSIAAKNRSMFTFTPMYR